MPKRIICLIYIVLLFASGCSGGSDSDSDSDSVDATQPDEKTLLEIDRYYAPGDNTPSSYPTSYYSSITPVGFVFSEYSSYTNTSCSEGHGVRITWKNMANMESGITGIDDLRSINEYGLCRIEWKTDNIPLEFGNNEIQFFAESDDGYTAELIINYKRLPYKPLEFYHTVCDGVVTFTWVDPLFGADSYNLYYSDSNYYISKLDENDILAAKDVKPPYTFTGLNPDKTYYFKVSGVTHDNVIGYTSLTSTSLNECDTTVPSYYFESQTAELQGYSYFDFDDDNLADIYWDPAEKRLTPVNGALIKISNISYEYLEDNYQATVYYFSGGIAGYDNSSVSITEHYTPDNYIDLSIAEVFEVYLGDDWNGSSGYQKYAIVQILDYMPGTHPDGNTDYLFIRYYLKPDYLN